jgi:hypothetical protein
MAIYESPLGYPNEHMRLLGLIAAHWELVDFCLERLIARVMDFDPITVALYTANIDFNRKLDLLTAHVRDGCDRGEYQDLWKEYNKLHARLINAQAARNDFVHSKWRLDAETGEFKRIKLKTRGGKFKITDVAVSTEELEAAVREIVNIGNDVVTFFKKQGIPV